MGFVGTIKKRICESNKKISFSQKSSVETKSAKKALKFGSMGQSFSVYSKEVIESALFDRVTRDCAGEVIRTIAVRRFRKIGSDEWFSVLAGIGNDVWSEDFKTASHEQAIEQGENNDSKMNLEKDWYSMALAPEVENEATSDNVESAAIIKKKKRGVIIYGLIGVAVVVAYNYYKNNK
jgi:hypothetical protein|tara:strand:+ start:2005 stop:2541 length:537 start_codon:yes stop_codon:yes gene_type:complete